MPRLRRSFDPTSYDLAREGRPLTPDELLLKDNIPAFGPSPVSLVEQMSERIVHVSSRSGEAEPMRAIDRQDGTSAFRLSESAFLGRLGGSGERAEVAHTRGATADTARSSRSGAATSIIPSWRSGSACRIYAEPMGAASGRMQCTIRITGLSSFPRAIPCIASAESWFGMTRPHRCRSGRARRSWWDAGCFLQPLT